MMASVKPSSHPKSSTTNQDSSSRKIRKRFRIFDDSPAAHGLAFLPGPPVGRHGRLGTSKPAQRPSLRSAPRAGTALASLSSPSKNSIRSARRAVLDVPAAPHVALAFRFCRCPRLACRRLGSLAATRPRAAHAAPPIDPRRTRRGARRKLGSPQRPRAVAFSFRLARERRPS